jgi:carnitine 3-dehydrogenase
VADQGRHLHHEELDDIMRYGFGLRWAQMGMFQTYRIAGGEAGMRHFMASSARR